MEDFFFEFLYFIWKIYFSLFIKNSMLYTDWKMGAIFLFDNVKYNKKLVVFKRETL